MAALIAVAAAINVLVIRSRSALAPALMRIG
jgi:hypothetical protein